jgi:diguanylate cyclase (GGDEF)-like protein/PAS domain S-box-containing protein
VGALAVVLAEIVGWAYDLDYLHGVSGTSGTGLHTLIALIVVAVGIVLLRPDRGIASMFRGEDPGARMARRLLPAVVLLPILIGVLRLEAGKLLGFDVEVGASIITLLTIAAFLALILVTSRRLREADLERDRADLERRQLAAIVDSSEDAIIGKDLDGTVTSWNRAAEALYGYSAADMVGRPISRLIPPDRADELESVLAEVRGGRPVRHFETERLAKGGRRVDVSLTISPIRDESGPVIGASTIARDVGERRRAEQAAQRLAAVVDSSEDAIIGLSPDGVIQNWNRGAGRIFGYSVEEMLGQPIARLASTEGLNEIGSILAQVANRQAVENREAALMNSDDDAIVVSITASPLYAGEEVVGISTVLHDITERKQRETDLREAEERFRSVFESSPVGIVLVAPDLRFIDANEAFCAFTGYTTLELRRMTIAHITHPEDLDSSIENSRRLIDGEASGFQADKRYISKGGQTLWASITVSAVRGPEGTPLYNVGIVEDIGDRRRFEQELRHLADHDALTGLCNRRRFEQELDRVLEMSTRYGFSGAVLLVDMDGLKIVNDTLGHAAGDRLLIATADALRGRARSTDVVARIGGDEFGVILPHAGRDEARIAADGVLAAIAERASSEGFSGRGATASIGIAELTPGHVMSTGDVLREADLAMYQAKAAGGGRVTSPS